MRIPLHLKPPFPSPGFQLSDYYSTIIADPTIVLSEMWAQYCHDRLFHTDIFHMPLIPALSHHALHLAKYLGILTETEDAVELETRMVDTLSTTLSMLGRLNVRIAPLKETAVLTPKEYRQTYTALVAAIAKSMEHAQHTSTIDLMIVESLSDLHQHTFSLLRASGCGMPYDALMIRRRIIQHRSIFSSQLIRQYNADQDI